MLNLHSVYVFVCSFIFVISYVDYFFTIVPEKKLVLLWYMYLGIKIQTEHFVLFSNTF